jgi:hypothetical protein
MAKKSDDKAPGYDATGYTGVAGYLWSTFKRGTEAQYREIGPRIEGRDVVYTFLTILKSDEAVKTAEVQTAIAKLLNKPAKMITVVMTHEPAPDAPPPLAGVDAPAVKEVVNA